MFLVCREEVTCQKKKASCPRIFVYTSIFGTFSVAQVRQCVQDIKFLVSGEFELVGF